MIRLDQACIVDCETTGFGPSARVVEVALHRMDTGEEYSTLVDPGLAIPSQATAVHGISDAMVRGQPTLASLRPRLRAFAAGYTLVAHNAPFDSQYLGFLGDTWLCTLRLARHLLVDAPSHKNGAILEYFGKSVDTNGQSLHRALADTRVTATNLRSLADLAWQRGHARTWEQLIALSASGLPVTAMPFGKHRGVPLRDVPTSYLQWLSGRPDIDADLRRAIHSTLADR